MAKRHGAAEIALANSLEINLLSLRPQVLSHRAPKTEGSLKITYRIGFSTFPQRSLPRETVIKIPPEGRWIGSGYGARKGPFCFLSY